MNIKFIGACASIATVAAMVAAAQTIIYPTSAGNFGAAPIGIAATTSSLLFTEPFCPGQQTRGIYSVSVPSGASTLVTPIPQGAAACTENYLVIAPGGNGFTAGDTYTTAASPTTAGQEAVYKNGVLFIDHIPAPMQHAGITFDTVGTFGGDLIVTGQGVVMLYNAAGVLQATYNAPANLTLEGATVAPLSYAACSGCLFITAELTSNVDNPNPTGVGQILVIRPNTPSGTTATFFSNTQGPEPEGLVFVTNNSLACTNQGFDYFVSGYATGSQINNNTATNGAILAYTPAQLAPFVGQFLVPDETTKVISAYSGPGMFTTFSTTTYQLEASAILQCPTTANGCPATFGFWKHHPFPSSMFVNGLATIGCQTYTRQALLDILNDNNAGGNAVTILGHQLIAAIANYAAGGRQTQAATMAIAQANNLLCANHINLSTDFVQSGTTLGAQMTTLAGILDAYNSSAPSCEGQF